MVEITLANPVPSTLPDDGWKVRYRIKGSGGAYTTHPVQMSFPIVITTTDPGGTLYEGFISRDCGDLESTEFAWSTPCECAATYSPNVEQDGCEKVETTAATVTNSGYCLATSQNSVYSQYESRIYSTLFVDADLNLPAGSAPIGGIAARMTTAGQWANPAISSVIGPMNRCAVWIDSDCNGVKDSLSSGTETTVACSFNNSGTTRTIYVGCGADNSFKLIVNGTQVASIGVPATPSSGSDLAFKIWHIIPITIVPGVNFINIVGRGDGSVNDALGMVVYDNSIAQLQAATSDSSLNILFTTEDLRGSDFDVATCGAGYSLDTSGGSGSYICRRVLTKVCNSADM